MSQEMAQPDPTLGDDAAPVPAVLERPVLIYDEGDPYSVVNLVTERVREAMLRVPADTHALSEGQLRQIVAPTHTDDSLRVSFWREYEKCVAFGLKRITATSIFSGICTEGYFFKLLDNPEKVAWLVRPVQAYQKHVEALLFRGLSRVEEIVNAEITDKDGKLDVKRARLVLEAVVMLDNRAKGMAVQKVQKESKSLKVSVTAPPAKVIPQTPIEQLRARVAELEGTSAKPLPQGPQSGVVIDAPHAAPVAVSSQEGEREVVTVGVVRRPADDPG